MSTIIVIHIKHPLSPVPSNPSITVIGDDESTDQALALAVAQRTSDFQPFTNLILINANPKLTQERFQIDIESISL